MPASFVYSNLTSSSTLFGAQTFSQRMRNFGSISKPIIEINIEDAGPTKLVHTFSTLDTVKGTVSIVAPSDLRFDDLQIAFVGATRTFVERVGTVAAAHGRNEAFHPFLKLQQPIDESLYPQPRVLEAGKVYNFPFTFVVPQNLLIQTCHHKAANPKLKDAHLQLPPSLGDPELAGTDSQLLSDMAPEMSKISYSIKARLVRHREKDGKEIIMTEKQKKVRVVPATEEQPPVDVDGIDEELCLRKEKGIKKGLFKSKLGRLIMEAEQPKSFRLPAPNGMDKGPVDTMATVLLRFEAADADARPPRLGSLASKIKAITFYAASPRNVFPSKATAAYDALQGVHFETVTLSSRCMASAQWIRHDPHSESADSQTRRDSGISTTDYMVGPSPSASYSSDKPFYTARLVVPFSLPTNRIFVPTFHTCLVSRVYILDMALNIPSTSSGIGTTVTLRVPVQVSSRGSHNTIEAISPLSDEEELAEERAADDFFVPRSIAPPSDEYLQTSTIPGMPQRQRHSVAGPPTDASSPPEYSDLAPRRSSVPVH